MISNGYDRNAKGCPSSPLHRSIHDSGGKNANGGWQATSPPQLPRPPVFLPWGPKYIAEKLSAARAKALLPRFETLTTKSKAERLEIVKGYIAIMFEDGNTLAMIRSDGLWEVYNAEEMEVKDFYTAVVKFVQDMIITQFKLDDSNPSID